FLVARADLLGMRAGPAALLAVLALALVPLAAAAEPAPHVLVVPDLTGQAYVFAKGELEDAGFAWVVDGPVKGFAANTVAARPPAARGARTRARRGPGPACSALTRPRSEARTTPRRIRVRRSTPPTSPTTASRRPRRLRDRLRRGRPSAGSRRPARPRSSSPA